MDAVEQHVVQSGKYAELGEIFRARLQAAGWYDKVLAYAGRELSVVDSPSVNSSELANVHQQAMNMMPEEVKQEMLKIIEEVVDDLVEKV